MKHKYRTLQLAPFLLLLKWILLYSYPKERKKERKEKKRKKGKKKALEAI
jgi:hypothetical protein